ncbi:hypothetical protein AVEN_112510-1, partial [Araneus ventricosus]
VGEVESVEAPVVGEVESLAFGEMQDVEALPADGIIAIIQGSMKRNRILFLRRRGENSRNLHQNFI